MGNDKHLKLIELIEELEVDDLPEDHTLIYLGNQYIDVLSNASSEESLNETTQVLLGVVSALSIDLVNILPKDVSLVSVVEQLAEQFKRSLLSEISQDKELFDRYLREASNILIEDYDEDEDEEEKDEEQILH